MPGNWLRPHRGCRSADSSGSIALPKSHGGSGIATWFSIPTTSLWWQCSRCGSGNLIRRRLRNQKQKFFTVSRECRKRIASFLRVSTHLGQKISAAREPLNRAYRTFGIFFSLTEIVYFLHSFREVSLFATWFANCDQQKNIQLGRAKIPSNRPLEGIYEQSTIPAEPCVL